MKKTFQLAGRVACFVALFILLGGHWLVLQSVAWTRMLADYSRQDSLTTAISKTFDGEHPCPMCLKIRAARQQEEQQEKHTPLVKTEKLPDYVPGVRLALLPFMAAEARDAVPTVPRPHSDFIKSPLTPPPRGFFAVS